MKKVLIIGSRNSGKKNDPAVIAEALSSDTVTTTLWYWEDITFAIQTGSVEIAVDDVRLDAESFDLVIGVGWYKNGDQAIYRDVAFSLALVLQQRGIPFWNSEMARQRSTSKLSTMVQLALEGVPVPSTYFSLDARRTVRVLPMPFIAKAAAASRGRANFLVDSEAALAEALESSALLVQPFLPNDHDLRVICYGGAPQLILRRARAAESATHLNNTSQGGSAQWIDRAEVPEGLLTISEKICRVMARELAGIDFIPDARSPFGYSCLEVNAIPQLTSGTDTDKKLTVLRDIVQGL